MQNVEAYNLTSVFNVYQHIITNGDNVLMAVPQLPKPSKTQIFALTVHQQLDTHSKAVTVKLVTIQTVNTVSKTLLNVTNAKKNLWLK